MNLASLVLRGKRHDVTAAKPETVNANFEQTFTDIAALVMALRAKRIDLTDPDDVETVLADLVADLIPPVVPPDPVLRCALYKSTAQSITNNSYNTLTFDAEEFDDDGLHEGVTHPSRITIPTDGDGDWLFTGALQWAAHATGARVAILAKNGTQIGPIIVTIPGTASYTCTSTFATLHRAVAGDYFEVQVLQDSGGALNVGASGSPAAGSSRFQAVRVGT